VGREYEVFAVSKTHLGVWHATFEHHEAEFPVEAPLGLFEVTEPSVPVDWRFTVDRGDIKSAGPPEFEDLFFADDVQERRNDAYQRYRGMKERLGVSRVHWRRSEGVKG